VEGQQAARAGEGDRVSQGFFNGGSFVVQHWLLCLLYMGFVPFLRSYISFSRTFFFVYRKTMKLNK
jgi:hypothetical protein